MQKVKWELLFPVIFLINIKLYVLIKLNRPTISPTPRKKNLERERERESDRAANRQTNGVGRILSTSGTPLDPPKLTSNEDNPKEFYVFTGIHNSLAVPVVVPWHFILIWTWVFV